MAKTWEEVSFFPNSPQFPRRPLIDDNHVQGASSSSTLVNPGKRKWIYHRRLWSLVAVIIVLIVALPLGFALRMRDLSIPSQPNTDNSTIQLEALLVDIDPRSKTMTIDWLVASASCESQPCGIYDIFFDNSLLVSESKDDKQSNNSIPDTPVFSINPLLLPGEKDAAFANFPFFTTKISLIPGVDHVGKERSLQSYPFDRYLAIITIFAKNRNVSLENPRSLVSISIADSQGIAAGFKAKVDTSDIFFNNGTVGMFIDISRGKVVKVYAVVMVIAIWMITLVLLSATVSSVVLGYRIAKEVLLLPVATLFAFTQLRATLPGAPEGFGAIIDYIGILPCLAILTLCSVLHIGVFLVRDPEKDRSDLEGKIVYTRTAS